MSTNIENTITDSTILEQTDRNNINNSSENENTINSQKDENLFSTKEENENDNGHPLEGGVDENEGGVDEGKESKERIFVPVPTTNYGGTYSRDEMLSMFQSDYPVPVDFVFHDKITTTNVSPPVAFQPVEDETNTVVSSYFGGASPRMPVRGRGVRVRGRGRGKRGDPWGWDGGRGGYGRGEFMRLPHEEQIGEYEMGNELGNEEDLFGPLEPGVFSEDDGDIATAMKEREALDKMRQLGVRGDESDPNYEQIQAMNNSEEASALLELLKQGISSPGSSRRTDNRSSGHIPVRTQSPHPVIVETLHENSQEPVQIPPEHLQAFAQLEDKIWFYKDPTTQEQGPFTAIQMEKWLRHSYFKVDLLVRRVSEEQYSPLAVVFLREQCNPFTNMPLMTWMQIPPMTEFKAALWQFLQNQQIQEQMFQQQNIQYLLNQVKDAPVTGRSRHSHGDRTAYNQQQGVQGGPIFGPVMKPTSMSVPSSPQVPTARNNRGNDKLGPTSYNWNTAWQQQRQQQQRQQQQQALQYQQYLQVQQRQQMMQHGQKQGPSPSPDLKRVSGVYLLDETSGGAPVQRNISPVPRNVSPAPRSNAPIQRNVSPVPRNISPAPRTASPAPRTASPAPRTTSPVPRTTSPVPRNISPVPRTTSPVPRTTSPVPRTTSPTPPNIPLDESKLDESSQPWAPPYYQHFNENQDYPTLMPGGRSAPVQRRNPNPHNRNQPQYHHKNINFKPRENINAKPGHHVTFKPSNFRNGNNRQQQQQQAPQSQQQQVPQQSHQQAPQQSQQIPPS